MDDFAVIGGGIGGACSALFLSERFETTLYEKESTLGGCASTFKHKGHFYNAGATTFAGYEEGSYMYELFKSHDVNFKSKKLGSALCVIMGDKRIERYHDVEAFIDEINRAFYHPKNRAFYTLMRNVQKDFLAIDTYTYSNASLMKKVASLVSFKTLFARFYPYLFKSGKAFVMEFFGEIDERYLNYMDNQILIVAQARLSEVNALTALLALAYQFMANHYVYGGMGGVFNAIEARLAHVSKRCFIERIERHQTHYRLQTRKGSFDAKNIVLGASLFDAMPLFEDVPIQNYLKTYQKLDSSLSAFMLYARVGEHVKKGHHYQIILPQTLPYCVSNALFVSFGMEDDPKIAQSITVSVHTLSHLWQTPHYEAQKNELEAIILEHICTYLELRKEDIVEHFSGTPQSFKRFINRSTLGGIPLRKEHWLPHLPSNDSPIKGFYHVGDTTFAAQGWPGVMMGVRNLERLICNHS